VKPPSDEAMTYAKKSVANALSAVVASDETVRLIAYAYDAGRAAMAVTILQNMESATPKTQTRRR
jgi:hypothetical protein